MYGEIVRGQAEAAVGRLTLALGRRPSSTEFRPPPDSALARDAEEAAADQPDALVGHGYRTWAFGRALAAVDGFGPQLDDELFYVGCLLHDVGLMEAVAGEDFTLRSAAAAETVAARHCSPDDVELVADSIIAHCTPGATPERDGPLGFFMLTGAVCDLGGLRLQHLSREFVEQILNAYPRTGLVADIVPRIQAEAKAVPDGRFAVLCKSGFTPAIRFAPLPS
jgi:hypothetical protein